MKVKQTIELDQEDEKGIASLFGDVMAVDLESDVQEKIYKQLSEAIHQLAQKVFEKGMECANAKQQ